MRIRDYPYGKINKRLRKAVTWLNRNRRRIEQNYSRDHVFDYPLYWGMPKAIAHKLNPDEVDWLQSETYIWNYQWTGENE
jgi:hypothetical protein